LIIAVEHNLKAVVKLKPELRLRVRIPFSPEFFQALML